MLSEVTGVAVQPNKAIIGLNAFAHAAGIHQDGMIKNPLTYEIITPKSVGVPDSTLVLCKHSGRHALGQRYEQLGYQFDRRQLDDIYRQFIVLADKIKRVEDSHLRELAKEVGAIKESLLPEAPAGATHFRSRIRHQFQSKTARVAGHEHHGSRKTISGVFEL